MGFDFWSLDPWDWTGKQSELSLFPKDKPLEDIRSEDQKTTQQILMELATKGTGGGITLGEPYGGSLGEFSPTQFEQSGLAKLFNQQPIGALSSAEDVFKKLSTSAFDPSVLDPVVKAMRKSGREGESILERESAITGSRYGTGIQERKVDLATDIESGIQQQLAGLFLNQQQVGLQGAQGLLGVGGAQAKQHQTQLQNLFQFGALTRQLKNQEAQAKFNEYNRQRDEKVGTRLGLIENEANRNPYMGFSTVPGYSALTELMKPILEGATKAAVAGGA